MAFRKSKTTGPGEKIRFVRRQKRNPRRLLEAHAPDWRRWDAAAEISGLNWSEFTRRALNAAADSAGVPSNGQLAALSEKGAKKNEAKVGPKWAPKRAARKGHLPDKRKAEAKDG